MELPVRYASVQVETVRSVVMAGGASRVCLRVHAPCFLFYHVGCGLDVLQTTTTNVRRRSLDISGRWKAE